MRSPERFPAARDLRRRAWAPGIEATFVTGEITDRIKRARLERILVARRYDHGDVEDLENLWWQENDKNGKPVTKMQMKLTFDGAQRLINRWPRPGSPRCWGKSRNQDPREPRPRSTRKDMSCLRLSRPGPRTRSPGKHAQDGQYNAGTLSALETAKQNLAIIAKDKSLDAHGIAMVKQYQGYVDALYAAKAKTGPVPAKGTFSQFTYKPAPQTPAQKKAAAEADYQIQASDLAFVKKPSTRGVRSRPRALAATVSTGGNTTKADRAGLERRRGLIWWSRTAPGIP